MIIDIERTSIPELFLTPRYARYMTEKERYKEVKGFEQTLANIYGENIPSKESIGKWIDFVSGYENYEDSYASRTDFDYAINITISPNSSVCIRRQDIDLVVDGHYVSNGIYINIDGTNYSLPLSVDVNDAVQIAFSLDSIHNQLKDLPYSQAVKKSAYKDKQKFEKGLEDLKNGTYNSFDMPWGARTFSEQQHAIVYALKSGLIKKDIIPNETDKKKYTKNLEKFYKLMPELVAKYKPIHEQHLQEQKNNGSEIQL